MFTLRLVEYLRAQAITDESLEDFAFYAESMPAVKDIATNIVSVFSITSERDPRAYLRSRKTIRFIVSGSITTAYSQAYALRDFFLPLQVHGNDPFTGFIQNEYQVFKVIPDQEPNNFSNQGNIYFANFTMRFLVARSAAS